MANKKTSKNANNSKKNRKANVRKAASQLLPIDDLMFEKMAEDRNFCQEILPVISKRSGAHVLTNYPQWTGCNLRGRSVRLDLLMDTVNDLGSGNISDTVGILEKFNILNADDTLNMDENIDILKSNLYDENEWLTVVEVHRQNDDDMLKRARFNMSIITDQFTVSSSKFRNVPNVETIFITEFDAAGEKKGFTEYPSSEGAYNKIRKNGWHEVYIDVRKRDDPVLSILMRIFTEQEFYDYEKFPITSNLKYRYKHSAEGRRTMTKIIQDLIDEAKKESKEEGRVEGLEEGQFLAVKKLLHTNALTLEQAAVSMDMSPVKLQKELAKFS